jgi:hypothetical protein
MFSVGVLSSNIHCIPVRAALVPDTYLPLQMVHARCDAGTSMGDNYDNQDFQEKIAPKVNAELWPAKWG